jgi:hypothetical protein
MYSKKLTGDIEKELENLKAGGKFKVEREIEGAQGAEVSQFAPFLTCVII